MRNYKTSQKKRGQYRYYFTDGTYQELSKREIEAETLVFLHQLDDLEVDANRREDYHIPIHYENYTTSEGDSLNENPLFLMKNSSPLDILIGIEEQAEDEKQIEKLHQAIESLTPNQRNTVQKLFVEGKSQVVLAREEGVSKMAITNRLKKIYTKLGKEISK